jgi:hypothetical protein
VLLWLFVFRDDTEAAARVRVVPAVGPAGATMAVTASF